MKLKKWQMILIVVVGVGIVGSFMGGNSDDNSHDTNDVQTVEKEEKKSYKMNETVRVGDVEYVVSQKVVSKTIVNERLMRDVLTKKQRKDVIGSWGCQ